MKRLLISTAFACGAAALLGLSAGPVRADGPPAAWAAVPACEPPAIKKVCVGEPGVKQVEKRVYGEACEDFCVPKCSLFGGACADCEHHARTRKYLVVKVKHEEEVVNKCRVEYRLEGPKCQKPACAEGTYLPPQEK